MTEENHYELAPELEVSEWINTPDPLTLSGLRGKIVIIHAFQMLCPGCVSHGIPQARSMAELYAKDDVQVIGLHTVFEHHEVMTPAALRVFLKEYRVNFPVAVDTAAESGPIPMTMARYQTQGTPTLLVVDRLGQLRLHQFGQISDMAIGNFIGGLLRE